MSSDLELYPAFNCSPLVLRLPGVKQTILYSEEGTRRFTQISGLKKEDEHLVRVYSNAHNGMTVICSIAPREWKDMSPPVPIGLFGLHVSVALPNRLPTWEEFKAVKLACYGTEIEAFQVFPRQELWYSKHDYCLHLWELPFKWEVSTA